MQSNTFTYQLHSSNASVPPFTNLQVYHMNAEGQISIQLHCLSYIVITKAGLAHECKGTKYQFKYIFINYTAQIHSSTTLLMNYTAQMQVFHNFTNIQVYHMNAEGPNITSSTLLNYIIITKAGLAQECRGSKYQFNYIIITRAFTVCFPDQPKPSLCAQLFQFMC